MSVSVPQPFRTSVTVAQPFRAKVEGIPDAFGVSITDLPNLDISIEKIPVLHLSVDDLPPVHISIDNLPPINVALAPIEIRLSEVPSTRVHIPADFSFGWSVLGMDFGMLRVCGEAQVITEPYRPNSCESCGRVAVNPEPVRPADPGTVVRPIPNPARPNEPVTPRGPN